MRRQDRSPRLLLAVLLPLLVLPQISWADSAPLPGLPADAVLTPASAPASGSASAPAPGSVTAPEPVSTPTFSSEPKTVPESAQLIVLPYFIDAEPSCLSVLDSQGKPIEGATVSVDQELFNSAANGVVSFKVPHADSFEICLYTEGKRKLIKCRFIRRGNVYAENAETADFISALLKSADTKYGAPQLIWSPAVLAPGSKFVLLGKNFSAKLQEDIVNIDGSDIPVLASSAEALLAAVPDNLSAGSSRELFVSSCGQNSNICELDLSTPFFTYDKSSTKADEDVALVENARVGVKSSTFPCLIRVKNLDPDSATLWSPTQEPLWKNNIVLTPGGEQNLINISVRRMQSSSEPKVELSLENTISSEGKLLQALPLQSAVSRAEILLLARKKNAAESKLDELRKSAPAQSPVNPPTEIANNMSSAIASDRTVGSVDPRIINNRNEEECRVLSNKLLRISRMLASRKAVFEALGNSEEEYRKALDDAAGGALSLLDQAGRIQVLSEAASSSSADSAGQKLKKGRPLRMLEPTIRLLPPMSAAELASINMNPSNVDAPVGNARSASSDEPQLRPSLPEPEPEVSASSRDKTGDSVRTKPELKPQDTIKKPERNAKEGKDANKSKDANKGNKQNKNGKALNSENAKTSKNNKTTKSKKQESRSTTKSKNSKAAQASAMQAGGSTHRAKRRRLHH